MEDTIDGGVGAEQAESHGDEERGSFREPRESHTVGSRVGKEQEESKREIRQKKESKKRGMEEEKKGKNIYKKNKKR